MFVYIVLFMLIFSSMLGLDADTEAEELETTFFQKSTIKKCNLYFKFMTLIFWLLFISFFSVIFYQTTKTSNVIDFKLIDADSIKIKTNINDNYQKIQLKDIECLDVRKSTKNKDFAKKYNISVEEAVQKGKNAKQFVKDLLKRHSSDISIKYSFLYPEDVWSRRYANLYVGKQNIADILVETGQCIKKEGKSRWFIQDRGFTNTLTRTFYISLISLLLLCGLIYCIKGKPQYDRIKNTLFEPLGIVFTIILYVISYALFSIITFFPFTILFKVFYLLSIAYTSSFLLARLMTILSLPKQYNNDYVFIIIIISFAILLSCVSFISRCGDGQYAKANEDTCYIDDIPEPWYN